MNALKLPPKENMEVTSRNIRLLTVRQPSTDGQVHLTGVPREMEAIKQMTSSSTFVKLQEADGTVQDVLAKLTETNWVHFACHGTQDGTNPFDSGLLLADCKRLKLSDITQLSRPRGVSHSSLRAKLQQETSNFRRKPSILRLECFLRDTGVSLQPCGQSWIAMRQR